MEGKMKWKEKKKEYQKNLAYVVHAVFKKDKKPGRNVEMIKK